MKTVGAEALVGNFSLELRESREGIREQYPQGVTTVRAKVVPTVEIILHASAHH